VLDPLNDQYRLALAEWQIESGAFAAATETLEQVSDPNERAARLAERASLATTGVPVHASGDQLLADVGIGGVQLTLLVDTGATHTSLEAGALQRIAGERLHSAVSVRTAAGVVDLPLYRVADVTLGALEVPTLDVLELDADLPGVEGLLGMDLLRRVGLPRLKPGEARDPGEVPP
jgi:predicted aspartyl protease